MPNILLAGDDALRIFAQTYKNPQTNPQDDLSSYQTGKYFVKYDRRQRSEPFANNWQQLRWSATEALWGTSAVAFSSARVHRGEVLPTATGVAAGIVSFPALANVIAPAVRWFITPFALGATGTGMVASLLAIKPAFGIGRAVASSIRWFSTIDYQARHIEMGGNYSDTDTALALRMRAVNEMSSAFGSSRRWLGNESEFLHDQPLR